MDDNLVILVAILMIGVFVTAIFVFGLVYGSMSLQPSLGMPMQPAPIHIIGTTHNLPPKVSNVETFWKSSYAP